MAAASLNTVMPELIEAFEATSGTDVTLVLGSTGSLAAQIEHGAPADVFFAADDETVARLAAAGEVRPESSRTYGLGELVMIWREGKAPPASVTELGEPRFETVAIANPEHAPYGIAAQEALSASGVWDAMTDRVVYGESVSQTYQLVETGNADAGIVARSVLPPGVTDFVVVDSALHAPIRHDAALLTRSTRPAAAEFLDFVTGAAGQRILAAHGFSAP